MTSRTTRSFREAYSRLPEDVQRRARESYRLFCRDPQHPSLRFKRVHASESIYSVRVNLDYRAVGVLDGNEIVWFWIGSHSDYDQLLDSL